MNRVAELVTQTHNFLAGIDDPVVTEFLLEWPHNALFVPPDPTDLPVLQYMPEISKNLGAEQTQAQRLAQELIDLVQTLSWRQTYSADDFGADFLEGYGWTMIVGPGGLLKSTSFLCGVLVLAPCIEYPFHSHQAEEIYIPLAGLPAFRLEDQPWRPCQPTEVIHHESWTPHAIQSGDQPCLIISLWRKGDLKQKSKIGLQT
jgi:hypothetical protein